MNPKYPLYIVSKGRYESRYTSKALEKMSVPYSVVIEEQEFDLYASVIDKRKLLILPRKYQDEYDTYDNLGYTKSKGPGAARNFAWDHSISIGAKYHWVMDDNIRGFHRYNKNLKVPVGDGTIFRCMEDFTERYSNLYMGGPHYFMFVWRKDLYPPYTLNTRVYSCNLIKNNIPYRWRGRYNEDTDLSLRILKDGFCTIQFNAFLQYKLTTQTVKGGCDEVFYSKEGTLPKSQILVNMHPDVARLCYRFNREHHYVDYSVFKQKLKLRDGIEIPRCVNNYGMKLYKIDEQGNYFDSNST